MHGSAAGKDGQRIGGGGRQAGPSFAGAAGLELVVESGGECTELERAHGSRRRVHQVSWLKISLFAAVLQHVAAPPPACFLPLSPSTSSTPSPLPAPCVDAGHEHVQAGAGVCAREGENSRDEDTGRAGGPLLPRPDAPTHSAAQAGFRLIGQPAQARFAA